MKIRTPYKKRLPKIRRKRLRISVYFNFIPVVAEATPCRPDSGEAKDRATSRGAGRRRGKFHTYATTRTKLHEMQA